MGGWDNNKCTKCSFKLLFWLNYTIDSVFNFYWNPRVVKNTLIHFKIVLNLQSFILQCIFSGWRNEMSPEKICTTLVSGIHLKQMKIFYQADWKNAIQLTSPQTNYARECLFWIFGEKIMMYCHIFTVIKTTLKIACCFSEVSLLYIYPFNCLQSMSSETFFVF